MNGALGFLTRDTSLPRGQCRFACLSLPIRDLGLALRLGFALALKFGFTHSDRIRRSRGLLSLLLDLGLALAFQRKRIFPRLTQTFRLLFDLRLPSPGLRLTSYAFLGLALLIDQGLLLGLALLLLLVQSLSRDTIQRRTLQHQPGFWRHECSWW